METSRKKLRNSDFDCVFCHQYIEDHSSRYLTNNQSKSGVETIRLLNDAPIKDTFSNKEKTYLCKTCRRLLQKRDNLKRNLLSTESELTFRSTISSSISAEKFTSTPTKTVTNIPPRCNLSPILLPINKETKIPKRLGVTV